MPIRSPSGRCRQRASFSSTARCTAGSYICPGTGAVYGSASSRLPRGGLRWPTDPVHTGWRRAAIGRPRRRLLATQVQANPEQAGAFLHGVGRGALQVEPQVQRRTRAARAPQLLAAELLAHDGTFANLRDQLTQRPGLIRLRVDVVA